MTVQTKKQAWRLADRLFETDYMEDVQSSNRAGYKVYRSTADGYYYHYICDLGNRLELNFRDGSTINILVKGIEKENYTDSLYELYA